MSTDSEKSPRGEYVKVLLRRLPKYMTEKEVLEQISPIPEEVVETSFRPANFAFDRAAYASLTLVFSEYCESMMDFERRFDGYIFVDSRGNDSTAVVEASINQNYAKCDRARMQQDTRVGAIVSDKYYLDFCEQLEKEKSLPIMTLEQQIRKLNQPEDTRIQINRLETPLVKFFMEKECGKRREYDVRKQKRDMKKTEKQKNVLDILLKPSTTSASTSAAPAKREFLRESKKPLSDREKEQHEAMKKERTAMRKQKFLDEKKKRQEERELENPKPPRGPRENNRRKERPGKQVRPVPAKTVGEQQGEDWIKKLTDPKSAPMKKKHDLPVTVEEKKGTGTRPRTAPTRKGPNASASNAPKRPSTAPK